MDPAGVSIVAGSERCYDKRCETWMRPSSLAIIETRSSAEYERFGMKPPFLYRLYRSLHFFFVRSVVSDNETVNDFKITERRHASSHCLHGRR